MCQRPRLSGLKSILHGCKGIHDLSNRQQPADELENVNRQQPADDFKKVLRQLPKDVQAVLPSVEEIENELNDKDK